MNTAADLTDIRTRLDQLEENNHRLEKQNRRLKLLAAVMLLAVGAVLVFGLPQATEAQAKKGSKTVEANKFVAVDAKGTRRAQLDESAVMFFDEKGKQLAIYSSGAIGFTREGVANKVSLDRDGGLLIGGKDGGQLILDSDGTLRLTNSKGKSFKAP